MTPCHHCHARPWTDRWDVKLCANKRRPRVAKLCRECDAELNEIVLRFVGHPRAEELMTAYRARRQPQRDKTVGDYIARHWPVK